MRWSRAGWSPGTRDFMTVGVHAPAETGAAVALQRQEAALLVTLGDVDPDTRVEVLSLGSTLLTLTGCHS